MNPIEEIFSVRPLRIPGCSEINPVCRTDHRGQLVKLFHREAFPPGCGVTPLAEEFSTTSTKGTLRGMHFQLPPMDGVKLVSCLYGEVMDVLLDLRLGSPTYGEHEVLDLSGGKSSMVRVAAGVAHGFYVCSESAVLLYKMDKVHSPKLDGGIHWASAGIPWPDANPTISGRDQALPGFGDFVTPFQFVQANN